ncbi:MAG TPA: response regulator [Burkholderiaceae bacterium]|nr:response regulator [Burkholderiaceae bacterium]
MDTLTVSRVFAIAVREVMPTLVRRHQSYTYAEHHCAWRVGSRGRMVETSIRRLALCASDILRQGFVAFDARVRPSRPSGCTLHVRIAGAGPLRPHGEIERALAELGLEADTGEAGGSTQLKRAHGTCPATQAHVEFAGLPLAGFIFNAAYRLRDASEVEPQTPDTAARAGGRAPRLWLLQPDALSAASITAQAQGHGWAVSAFTSATQVKQQLRRVPVPARPDMFACFLRDAASIEEARVLSECLPAATHRVGAIDIGADWLGQGEPIESFELACHPFCHDDWKRWAALLMNRTDEAADTVEPALPTAEDRVSILIVDDDEFSRELTRAMVLALGYDCVLARDGQQAIECCRRDGPALVLMDLEMPLMNGYEATRALRSLQRAGAIAHGRIIAYSSSTSADAVRRALLAGADCFLSKPVSLDELRAELRRWCVARLPPPAPLSSGAAQATA